MSSESNAFHPGEQAIQERLGVKERMQMVGTHVMRPFMPDQHRELFEKLPLVFLGATDHQGQPWASVRVGQPGFVHTPDAETLLIQSPALAFDPLADLQVGQAVGFLGLEYETRRRNRISSAVSSVTDQSLALKVRQSFGNCPKYIQTRQSRFVKPAMSPECQRFDVFEGHWQSLIEKADHFMIATLYQPEAALSNEQVYQGADVSHRGGKPGFVKVTSSQSLCFPDFSGNLFFNTLGNLQLNPHAGLLFIDFEQGDLLYLTGKAHVIWEGPELERFAGAERLVSFELDHGFWVKSVLGLRWDFGEYSSSLSQTGTW